LEWGEGSGKRGERGRFRAFV